MGQTVIVRNAMVSSWARLLPDDTVVEVGVTMPVSIAERSVGRQEAPSEALLDFPAPVARTTFIDHFTLDWLPIGHPPKGIFTFPHFDLHFQAIPYSRVAGVAADATALPRPAADRIPAGYLAPASDDEYLRLVVPQLGYRLIPAAAFEPGYRLDKVMVYGCWQGEITFLEPMVTQAQLLRRESFTLEVRRPAVLGRATRYPTRLRVTYDADEAAYEVALTDFVNVER